MAERKYQLVFYAAVAVALIATFGVYKVLEATRASSRIATAPVVVATQDMPEGSSIDRVALNVSQWPVATVPAGAFPSVDSVIGRVTRVAIFKGEPIVPGRLAPAGTGPGLEVKITPGKRAMSVRINDVAGISGLIQPNSRVDIMVMIQTEQNARQVAKLFMENMRVLSVGTQVQRGEDGRPISATTVTIEVTPEEAERLAVATTQGSIQLVLRGYGDPDSVRTKGATSSDVLTGTGVRSSAPEPTRVVERSAPVRRSAPAAAPAPAPAVVQRPRAPDSLSVQVFRGSAVTQQKFQRDSAARRDSASRPVTTP